MEYKIDKSKALEKAQNFLKSVEDKPHGQNSISRSNMPCNILINVYQDAIKDAINPKKHEEIASRNDWQLFRDFGVFKNHMINTYSIDENMTLVRGLELQIQALKGKPNKTFINKFLNSNEKYLKGLKAQKA